MYNSINTSGKYTKNKKGKCRQLRNEMARQIEKLLAWNYRPRCIQHKINDKWLNRKDTPMPKITYPLFAPYHSEVVNNTNKRKKVRSARDTRLLIIMVQLARSLDGQSIDWE